jgi:hypothetical protein
MPLIPSFILTDHSTFILFYLLKVSNFWTNKTSCKSRLIFELIKHNLCLLYNKSYFLLVSKSTASLLLNFNLTKVAFFHSARNNSEYLDVAQSIRETFAKSGIKIRSVSFYFLLENICFLI